MGREFNVADKLMLSNIYKEHQLFKELDEMMDFTKQFLIGLFVFFLRVPKDFLITRATISCLFKVPLIQLKHC